MDKLLIMVFTLSILFFIACENQKNRLVLENVENISSVSKGEEKEDTSENSTKIIEVAIPEVDSSLIKEFEFLIGGTWGNVTIVLDKDGKANRDIYRYLTFLPDSTGILKYKVLQPALGLVNTIETPFDWEISKRYSRYDLKVVLGKAKVRQTQGQASASSAKRVKHIFENEYSYEERSYTIKRKSMNKVELTGGFGSLYSEEADFIREPAIKKHKGK